MHSYDDAVFQRLMLDTVADMKVDLFHGALQI